MARARLGAGHVVHAPGHPERGVGAVLAWADRQGVDELDVVVADAGGILARQAGLFTEPAVTVWTVDGSDLVSVAPDPPPPLTATAPDPALEERLRAEGLELVVEDGTTRGEVLGLEVARITEGDRLEVGVGAADRELTAMLHGDMAPVEQVRRAAAVVRQHRQPDAPPHPLNGLVPERWLRAVLVRRPDLLGLARLQPSDSPWPRQNLVDRGVALATGLTESGAPVVVAVSVGVDLELVPRAADARAVLDPGAELWLTVPERDDHEITRRLAARLREPARLVPVPDHWRSVAR